MELLERYLYEIGRRLPAKQREDIVKELRSLLGDALDARTQGRDATEEDVAAVLKEFGSPAEVASRYAGERYLIGPRMFDLYWLVLRIVLLCMTGGLLIALVVDLVTDTTTIPGALLRLVGFVPSLLTAAFTAFGYVTGIFFLVERAAARKELRVPLDKKEWNPKDLPRIPVRVDRVGPAGPIVAILFTLFGMWLFNLHPDLVAFVYTLNDGWSHLMQVPMLTSDGLAAYLPLWNVGWIATLVLQSFLLARGRWQFGTRIAQAALQFFNIGVLAYMIAGPALVSPDVFRNLPELAVVRDMFLSGLDWLFGFVIVVTFIDAVKSVVLAVKGRVPQV
jgi:hypothetical protein